MSELPCTEGEVGTLILEFAESRGAEELHDSVQAVLIAEAGCTRAYSLSLGLVLLSPNQFVCHSAKSARPLSAAAQLDSLVLIGRKVVGFSYCPIRSSASLL